MAANDPSAQSRDAEPAYQAPLGVLEGAAVWMVVLVLFLLAPYFFDGTTILVVGVVLGIAGLVTWFWITSRATATQQRQRAEQMQQMADSLGMTYCPTVPPELPQSLADLPCFPKGERHAVEHCLVGDFRGMTLSVFDFDYFTRGGEHSSHVRKTLVRIPNAGRLPDFSLRPERWDMKLSHWLGWPDIDFTGSESRDRFSRQYQLRGVDEAAVRSLFGDRAIAWLAERPGWTMECQRGALLIWRDAAPPAYKAHFRLTSVSETPTPDARYIAVQDVPLLLDRAVDLYRRLLPGDDAVRSSE